MKSYRFVNGEFTIKYEIKKSVFIATVKGDIDSDSAEEFVKGIKKKYSDATHNCYAYISDINATQTRFSDDGEPSGTAGQPILEVIRKQNLTKTAVVVTRYFGGIKLGAGGLVGAYTQAAVLALESAEIKQRTESRKIGISADYSVWASLEKVLRKKPCIIENTEYGDEIKSELYVKSDDLDAYTALINEVTQGKAKQFICDETFFREYE
ncbi:MAG: YigZ family protein [Clostridia bacterium]|nr:YigZ family protein [Clostridia bacterium]